ncbi:MAG TPA: hypothetical protein VMU27_00195 [Candidatus Paceibacterota bacterium]|nr:hypothetical protein [Candidatus Paceibacterota bacterium]
MPQTRVVLRWSAYEHEHIERGGDWFWALCIVAVSMGIVSILLHDTLFAILILFAAFTVGILAVHPPELAEFEISERGIRVAGKLHRYPDIIAFWVEDEHEGRPHLLLETKHFMHPNIIIPLEHIDPHLVRAFLIEHIEEIPMKEPLSHKILDFFGL